MDIDQLREVIYNFKTEKLGDSECIITGEYAIVPIEMYDKLKALYRGVSTGGKKIWEDVSQEERSLIARERGRAGAAKRWNKK